MWSWLKNNKVNIFLVILFSVLLMGGLALPDGNYVVHDKPDLFAASDAFIHYIWADALKDRGQYDVYPDYFSYGYKDVIAYNPPLFYHIVVIFSQMAMIPLYDACYFLIIFACIVGILALFLLIRKYYGDDVAFLSMPITLLLFFDRHYTLFTYGTWIYALASVFMIAMFYWIDDKELVILMLSAMVLTHTSEFIFAVGFIGLYILIKRFSNIKEQIMNVLTAMLITSYYLYIFYFTWLSNNPYHFAVEYASQYTGMVVMTMSSFGWVFGIILILGFIAVLIKRDHRLIHACHRLYKPYRFRLESIPDKVLLAPILCSLLWIPILLTLQAFALLQEDKFYDPYSFHNHFGGHLNTNASRVHSEHIALFNMECHPSNKRTHRSRFQTIIFLFDRY
jgi:hypothetical protein